MCDIRETEGELYLSATGRTLPSWIFVAEAIGYQVLCATGFIANVLAFIVLSLPRPSVQLHPSSIPSTACTLYRLVSLTLLLILPLFAARNILENSETVYSIATLNFCVLHDLSHLLSEVQVPFENLLLSLFVFLVADRYVTLYKPFRRQVLFCQHRSVYGAVVLLMSGFLLISAYPIYARASMLLQWRIDKPIGLEIQKSAENKTNIGTNDIGQFTEFTSSKNESTEIKTLHFWQICFYLFLLCQVLLSIVAVILPFGMYALCYLVGFK